tara:strand:- start:385 stop:675 length:291 start_codon:yes stop_codon:yes gene_type:complete
MTMTPQQKAERLMMIKEIAERNTLQRKNTFNTLKRKSKQSLEDVKGINRSKRSTEIREPVQGENVNYWTDSSKYAEEYYGEAYRATTGLDNDWGDY